MFNSMHQCIIINRPTKAASQTAGLRWLMSHRWRTEAFVRKLLSDSLVSNAQVYLPAEFPFEYTNNCVRPYGKRLLLADLKKEWLKNDWIIISPFNNYTKVSKQLVLRLMHAFPDAGTIALNVNKNIDHACETAILDHNENVCGFRRFYNSYAIREPATSDWPDHLIISRKVFSRLADDTSFAGSFSIFWKQLKDLPARTITVSAAGTAIPLSSNDAVLKIAEHIAEHAPADQSASKELQVANQLHTAEPSIRVFGTVLAGSNVTIEKDCVLIGPTIVGSNTKIGQGSLVDSSILDDGLELPQKSRVQDSFVSTTGNTAKDKHIPYLPLELEPYPSRGPFEYANYPKRIFDFVAASTMLVLTAPLMPFIAAAIKLESKGPVLFKHRRQGMNGKEFSCLKFRTMVPEADGMQDMLRALNEVDGPQFKMEDDPRVSKVGKLLRETYLDELPQLFNVLAGQMSLVGPRPSPAKENLYCPPWHDARLSVRPGITGLWQIKRNPERTHDFQEWLKFDTEYVNTVTFTLDMYICFHTGKKMIAKVVESMLPRSKNMAEPKT